MCIYIYIHIYIYIYIYIYAYIHTYTHIHIHTCVHIHIHLVPRATGNFPDSLFSANLGGIILVVSLGVTSQ